METSRGTGAGDSKQVVTKKEDLWPFENDWLDEYALTEEFHQQMEAAERMHDSLKKAKAMRSKSDKRPMKKE